MTDNDRIEKVARRLERLRVPNPMNGDGSNLMLTKAQQVLADEFPVAFGAIVNERRAMQAERDAEYERLLREQRVRKLMELRAIDTETDLLQ